MLRRVFGPALVTALIVALPAFTADDSTYKKKTDSSSQTPLDSDKLTPGDYTGVLETVPGSDGSFTLRIDKSHQVLNDPAAYAARSARDQTKIQAEQAKISGIQARLATAKPQQANQLQNQLQQANALLQRYTVDAQPRPSEMKTVTESKTYDMMLKEARRRPPQGLAESVRR